MHNDPVDARRPPKQLPSGHHVAIGDKSTDPGRGPTARITDIGHRNDVEAPVRSAPTNTESTNSSGVWAANSRVNASTTTASTPVADNRSNRWASEVSSAGARSGMSTAIGWGWKVTATEVRPWAWALATTTLSTARCPR